MQELKLVEISETLWKSGKYTIEYVKDIDKKFSIKINDWDFRDLSSFYYRGDTLSGIAICGIDKCLFVLMEVTWQTKLFYDGSAFYITKTNQVDKFVDIIKLADGKIESKHYVNCLGIELPKQFCLIKEKGKLVVDNNLKSIREEPICKL